MSQKRKVLAALSVIVLLTITAVSVKLSENTRNKAAFPALPTAPPDVARIYPFAVSNTNFFSTVSPKLRQFLADHPTASQALSNALSEAFGSRRVSLYYFYGDDETSEAWHYYPSQFSVGVVVRENQQPCDECICLMYEVVNSESENRYQELWEAAKTKSASKEDFVRELMRQEFRACKKTQALVSELKLTEKEIAGSATYERFTQCPTDFEKFLSLQSKAPPKYNLLRRYGDIYDSL
jgi:hypothetical protein